MLTMIMAIDDDIQRLKAERIYSNYERQMFFAARRILKDDMIAEDAVHNAFEGIIRNLKMIEEPDSVRTKSYVIRAAKNSAINIYNKNKRMVPIEDYQIEKGVNIEDSTKELMEDIYRLPQLYRDIIILKALYGYTYKEIAIAFHISESAAMKRMERAKKKLEQIMGGEK
ncbi:MAG: sigma-70 family RNA polymerase sigma factor [Anaerostipes sp.]|nr:sigma-70 family RNA polymerase sigma factor [Anaerostipes sp.]